MTRNFTVSVKEDSGGQPWLLVEPDVAIGLAAGQHIVMDLPEGADIAKAQSVANLINESVSAFRISPF